MCCFSLQTEKQREGHDENENKKKKGIYENSIVINSDSTIDLMTYFFSFAKIDREKREKNQMKIFIQTETSNAEHNDDFSYQSRNIHVDLSESPRNEFQWK